MYVRRIYLFFILFIKLTNPVSRFIHQQVTDLRPETNYVFLVRAENSQGLSLPGPLSDLVQTTNVNQHMVPQVELTRARDRLNSEILHLKEVQPLTSTSVKIMWDVSVGATLFRSYRFSITTCGISRQMLNLKIFKNISSTVQKYCLF